MQLGSLSGNVKLVFAGTYSENQTVVFASFNCFANELQLSLKFDALAPATAVLSRRALTTPDLVSCILLRTKIHWKGYVREKTDRGDVCLLIATCRNWNCT